MQILRFCTAAKIHTKVFWVMTPCNLVGMYNIFGDIYCLYFHDFKPTYGGNVFLQKSGS
jgi:hypothetical protein